MATDSATVAAPRKFYLIDASVAASYYAPSTAKSKTVEDRCKVLFTKDPVGIRAVFLIPSFAITEVFSVFDKYRWSFKWNSKVKSKKKLTPVRYRDARKRFHEDIHNGKLLTQCALDRYHILCGDLISPINMAYKISRSRKQKRDPKPASTFDVLLLSMGIWLQKQVGSESFAIVTCDTRMSQVAKRAKSVKLSVGMRGHLRGIASDLGLQYGPDVYPAVIDIGVKKKRDLKKLLPEWGSQL